MKTKTIVASIMIGFAMKASAMPTKTALPTEYFNQLVNCIYVAEGGTKTPYPYGIVSVQTRNKDHAREVCYKTVQNNYIRWLRKGAKGDFIEYLAKIYCPVGVENDKGLNWEWPHNVKTVYNRLYVAPFKKGVLKIYLPKEFAYNTIEIRK